MRVACPGFLVICRSYPGYIYQLLLYSAVFAFLRRFITAVDKVRLNTLKAIKDAFSKTIIVLFGILCYGLLFVVGCFLFATTTAGGLLRWCSIVPGGFPASSARRGIGSRCCPLVDLWQRKNRSYSRFK